MVQFFTLLTIKLTVMTFNKKMVACENFELFQVLALLLDKKYIHLYKMLTFEYLLTFMLRINANI